MAVGMVLLSRLDADTTKLQLALFMVVLGIGMGFLMQTTMLIAQNSVEQQDLGVASSAATFFRSIGGSFGVALFGAIFVRQLQGRPRRGSARRRRTDDRRRRCRSTRRRSGKLPAPVGERAAARHRRRDLERVPLGDPVAVVVPVLAVFIKEIALRGGPRQAAPSRSDRAAVE